MPNQEHQPVLSNRLTSHNRLFRNIPCYLIALSCLITAISPPANAVATTRKHSSKAGAKGKHAVPQKPDLPEVHPGETILMQAMKKELDRSFENLKNAGDNPLYFLSYRVYDNDELRLSASYGALDDSSQTHRRSLDIEARVGTPEIDNTHKMRENIESTFERMFSGSSGIDFSVDNDESAIITALWLATDNVFKAAQRKYLQVKANHAVKVSEMDPSPDFSLSKAVIDTEKPLTLPIDKKSWEDRLRKLSAIYKEYPDIIDADVSLNGDCVQRYIATSEGSLIQTSDRQARVFTSASALCDDGMKVHLFDSVEVLDPANLPDDKTLEQMIRKLAKAVQELRVAHTAEPYVGPAIIRNRAAGVFFHEILGHRVEGHRQKDEEEGRTFAKKVGEQIMPTFISVYDDPRMNKLNGKTLAGYYHYDNEGIEAQKVSIVDHGILKNFLMGRSPISDFKVSNGHSRAQPGMPPVARQGNLVVESNKSVPYEELRKELLEEAKRQNKPYGLVFDEIAGGFAITQSFMPQSFELLPLRVTRVWVDGRPDELLRGVNLVGTPLASLETIMAAANDTDTFNGVCGAESGWVPVSASAPSLLVRTLETAREYKEQSKPPILPAPLFENSPSEKSAQAKAQ